jgi:hypothetical protein
MALSKMFYDFTCTKCNVHFEARVYSFEKEIPCVNCGQQADRNLASPLIGWRQMGVSRDFPTASAKWDKMQYEKNRKDKGGRADGQPNLKEF